MLKLAANPVLSEGKQVKSNPSANRKGRQEKKTAALKAPFADLVAGMVSVAGNPCKNPAAGSQCGPASLRAEPQVCSSQPLAVRKVVKENGPPGKPENGQSEGTDRALRTAVRESPAVSGKGASSPGESNHLKPIFEGSLVSKLSEVSRANTAVGKIPTGEVYAGSSTNLMEAPGAAERRHPAAGARNVAAVQPDQAQGSVAIRTNMVQEGNPAEGGDGKQKPDPGPAATSRNFKTGGTDHGAGIPSGLSSAAGVPEAGNPQTMGTGPERAGLSQTQVDALMDRMVYLVKSAPSSLEVQLKPESLGNVNILVESRDGAINIVIAAQNHDTASMLNSNLASMRSHLEQQGINLQQMEVNQGYRENHDQSANQQERGRRPAGNSEVAPEEMISGSQSATSRRNRPGLNILA